VVWDEVGQGGERYGEGIISRSVLSLQSELTLVIPVRRIIRARANPRTMYKNNKGGAI
jgi:hypothetical protein